MNAENAEVDAINRLLTLGEELVTIDVRAESYMERLEAYCDAVDQHLDFVPRDLRGSNPDDLTVTLLLDRLRQQLVERHRLVVERAVQAKEGVAADLAKLRLTKRGIIAYLSQSLDKKGAP